MKNFKVNNLLFSLLTIAIISLFTSSCNKTELPTDEIPNENITQLAEKLASNPNFQASIKIHEQIGNDLMKFIKDKNVDITKDDFDVSSFISSNTVNEEEFARYNTNLFNDMPELHSITEQAFVDAVSLALSLLGEKELISRSCINKYNDCAQVAFLRLHYGYTSVYSYYAEYVYCVYNYYRCV